MNVRPAGRYQPKLKYCMTEPNKRGKVGGTQREDVFESIGNLLIAIRTWESEGGLSEMCVCVPACVCVCVCCLLYTSPSPRDMYKSRMPSSA